METAFRTTRRVRLTVIALIAGAAMSACAERIGSAPPDGDASRDGGSVVDAAADSTSGDATDAALADLGTDAPPDVAPEAGVPGLPCLPGNTCADGACCVSGTCIAPGHPCGTFETTVRICSAGSCGTCGGLDEPCCPVWSEPGCASEQILNPCYGCTAPQAVCVQSAGAPDGGVCAPCGLEGERCCADGCIGAELACGADGTCTRCGGVGEPCCQGGCTAAGTLCNGTCVSCGHPGEPCCSGYTCADGGCCMNTLSSAQLSTVCVAAPTCGCSAGRCTTCGVRGGPCCEGGTCGLSEGIAYCVMVNTPGMQPYCGNPD